MKSHTYPTQDTRLMTKAFLRGHRMKELSYLKGIFLVVLHQIDNFAIAAFPLGVGIASCVVSYLGVVKSLNITRQHRLQLVQ